MSVHLLRNFVWARALLRYDDATGLAEELERSDLVEVGEGFYVNIARDLPVRHDADGNDFAGYYETDDGPVFFWNAQRVALADRHYRGAVQKGEPSYRFTLSWQDQPRVAITYPGPPAEDYLFPLPAEDTDFFQWLAKYLPSLGFYACHFTLTVDDARRMLAPLPEADAEAATARLVTRSRQGSDEEQLRMAQAMVLLLEEGEAWERELAVVFLLERAPGLTLVRRLARSYAARGWDSGDPVVRLFVRYRDWLGEGGRASLRRCFLADPKRHAALSPLLEPSSGR